MKPINWNFAECINEHFKEQVYSIFYIRVLHIMRYLLYTKIRGAQMFQKINLIEIYIDTNGFDVV